LCSERGANARASYNLLVALQQGRISRLREFCDCQRSTDFVSAMPAVKISHARPGSLIDDLYAVTAKGGFDRVAVQSGRYLSPSGG